MQILARTALISFALSGASTALAGGLGILTNAGLHSERAYYYSQSGQQGIDSQLRPNYGLGMDAIVGDKDDKVQGLLRGAWIANSPTNEPDTGSTDDAIFPGKFDADGKSKADAHHVGALGLGVQWGLYGDPSAAQLTLTSVVGSGFITTDNTEYLFIEVGVGGTYNLSENIQAHGTLAATMRNRKHTTFGPDMYMGVRYLFD